MNNAELERILKSRFVPEESNVFPKTVLIDNSNYCNLRCSMCGHSNMRRRKGIMDIGLYKKIIDEIAEKSPGTRVWQILYGEPFSLKDMDERIKYAKDKGLTDVVLNSNGLLINDENARKIVQAGLDYLYVGIDSISEEIYSKLRVGGKLDTAVNGVLSYQNALKKYGSENQKLFVQFVEMDINAHEVNGFIDFWNDKGINVKIRPMVSWAGKIDNPIIKQKISRLPCKWVLSDLSITIDGDVIGCTCDLDCERPVGNVAGSSISEIWNGPLKKIRALHLEGRWDELDLVCQKCLDWQSGYSEYLLPEED